MLIFAIDDEPKMLRLLHQAIEEAAPDAEIIDFSLGSSAIDAIEGQKLRPEVVFSDIRMPGLDGLELAARIKRLVPEAKIVFVTGFTDYAVDAFRIHAAGYVLKPVTAQRIREELDHLFVSAAPGQDKLQVQCFGRFEVYWHGAPLKFERRQTKELFAFLIDKAGASCTAEEISAAMWENETDIRAAKTRIRQMVSDLRKTLSSIGMDDALIRYSGQAAIRRDRVDCDYYRMLEGDMTAVNSFRGEYMTQYSWAELTEGRLFFRQK